MSALSEVYTIPQEHLDFRDTIREIARERIAPLAAQIEPKDLISSTESASMTRSRGHDAEPYFLSAAAMPRSAFGLSSTTTLPTMLGWNLQ